MYIKHKPIAAFYKLALGTLALALQWLLMGQYGLAALNSFATWALFIAAVYFLSSALILALSHSQESGKNPCPMLEGMIIMAFLLMSVIAAMGGEPVANGFSQVNALVNFMIVWILPVLAILDWVFFVKKGRWRAMAPFYWLALPVGYLATMVLIEGVTSDSVLQQTTSDLYAMLISFLIFVVVELAVGYGFYLLDFALSGKLAKKIVLPHLQTVIVDAEGREIRREPTAEDFADTTNEIDAEDDLAVTELQSPRQTADDDIVVDEIADSVEPMPSESDRQKQKSKTAQKVTRDTIIIEKMTEPVQVQHRSRSQIRPSQAESQKPSKTSSKNSKKHHRSNQRKHNHNHSQKPKQGIKAN